MTLLNLFDSVGGAALISSITSLITWTIKTKMKEQQQDNEIMIALQALYSNEIRKKGRKYILRGFLTVDEYADIEQMNTIYHEKLNGNGYTKNIMEKIEMLPIKKDNEIIKGA